MKPPVHRMRKQEIIWLNNNNCKAHGVSYLGHYNCYLIEQPQGPFQEVVGFLDIETTSLNAAFGYIISYCFKELDGPIYEYCITPKQIRGGTFDQKLLEQFSKDCRHFDRWVVHWGKDARHDIPFLRTRSIKWGIPFPEYQEHYVTDTWDMAKRKLNLHSRSLWSICDFLEVPAKGHRLNPDIWQKAQMGDKAALDWILEHNREDVMSTEAVWKYLCPYVFQSRVSI